MITSYDGFNPKIHETAYVAPNAMVVGDVTIGADARIMFGAQVIGIGNPLTISNQTVIMENAVLRSTARYPLTIGSGVLVGPNAHLVGCEIDDDVFIATGAAVFHAAHLSKGCEVRINAVVHLKTRLEPDTVVPIGWVAVGVPPEIHPPSAHDDIWVKQEPLNFPFTAYGIHREEASTSAITRYFVDCLPLEKLPKS